MFLVSSCFFIDVDVVGGWFGNELLYFVCGPYSPGGSEVLCLLLFVGCGVFVCLLFSDDIFELNRDATY